MICAKDLLFTSYPNIGDSKSKKVVSPITQNMLHTIHSAVNCIDIFAGLRLYRSVRFALWTVFIFVALDPIYSIQMCAVLEQSHFLHPLDNILMFIPVVHYVIYWNVAAACIDTKISKAYNYALPMIKVPV